MTDKIDLKKTLDGYRARHNQFRVLEMPPVQYLMIDGHGDPNTVPEYPATFETLFPVAYKLKFASKKELGRDYVVMPLEGLWWSENPDSFTTARDKSRWSWTMMILSPDWISSEMFDDAVRAVGKKNAPPLLDQVRMEALDEGLCVQTLHVGSYNDESEILARMHDEFIPEQKLAMTKKHHEIYLSDARKVSPEKLRTILRQPVEWT